MHGSKELIDATQDGIADSLEVEGDPEKRVHAVPLRHPGGVFPRPERVLATEVPTRVRYCTQQSVEHVFPRARRVGGSEREPVQGEVLPQPLGQVGPGGVRR